MGGWTIRITFISGAIRLTFSPRSQETQDASRPPHVLDVRVDDIKTPMVYTPMLCTCIEYRALDYVEERHHGWMGGVENSTDQFVTFLSRSPCRDDHPFLEMFSCGSFDV